MNKAIPITIIAILVLVGAGVITYFLIDDGVDYTYIPPEVMKQYENYTWVRDDYNCLIEVNHQFDEDAGICIPPEIEDYDSAKVRIASDRAKEVVENSTGMTLAGYQDLIYEDSAYISIISGYGVVEEYVVVKDVIYEDKDARNIISGKTSDYEGLKVKSDINFPEEEEDHEHEIPESDFCTDKEKAAEFCTLEYRPVCGFHENGSSKTYGNRCGACADDVLYVEDGEC